MSDPWSDFGKRGVNLIPYHPIQYFKSQRKFLSGWRISLLTQYFYDRHLTRIYRGILDDHFTCDEKQKLEPLAIGMKKTIDETNEDWSKYEGKRRKVVLAILGPFTLYYLGLQLRNGKFFNHQELSRRYRKIFLVKWKWYSYNIIATAYCLKDYPNFIYSQMARNPYYNGTMKYTESLDPKLFKDFKDIINKEYYQRHLAIENETPFIVENSCNQFAWLQKSKISKAVSDSFVTMEELKEQERQLEAFSKDDSFITMEELKEQERQLEAFSKGEGFDKDKKEK